MDCGITSRMVGARNATTSMASSPADGRAHRAYRAACMLSLLRMKVSSRRIRIMRGGPTSSMRRLHLARLLDPHVPPPFLPLLLFRVQFLLPPLALSPIQLQLQLQSQSQFQFQFQLLVLDPVIPLFPSQLDGNLLLRHHAPHPP